MRHDPSEFRSISAPMGVPGMHRTDAPVGALPGLVIFVHGVNSDGEWYEASEQGLIRGLNARLGLDQAVSSEAKLQAVGYRPELRPNGSINAAVTGKTFIADHGFSPVIRFRWGYKAAPSDGTEGSQDEKQVYKGKVYLNELDAWGGGPFQNGTTALPYMWGLGLDDRVFWWLYANMFPVEGREVYASPPRAYYAHAAHRLKELIRLIREKQPDCPITVVCHSQGNMVTLGAALLGEKEGAIADTYVLCNPPYSLQNLGLEKLTNHDSRSAAGNFGSVTTEARMQTFKNFLQAVRERAGQGQTLEKINARMACKPEGQPTRFELAAFPADPRTPHIAAQDRDNRGKVFLYCNPHDQVIGVSPVQGIGWKGVSQPQMQALGAQGVLHQRVWAAPGGKQAQPFRVGCPAWTGVSYRYRDDNHDPKQFWNPPAPAMRYVLSLNESQGAVSQIFTVATAPIVWLVTRLFTLRINDDPDKEWAVPINAPVLPQPVQAQARRYGYTGHFDEGKDPARDALARQDAPGKLNDGAQGGAYDSPGMGDAESEAGLRYEHQARLRSATARGEIQTDEDQRAAVKRMLEENPNATDHSTILTNPDHAEKALAYDVAIGWLDPGRITQADLKAFRQFAHWVMLDIAAESFPIANQFMQYFTEGFYNGLQLHRTYNMNHMTQHAPKIIDGERERSMAGHLRG